MKHITDCGYVVLGEESVPQLQGKATLLRHAQSGARVLAIENGDVNKAFCIGFQTIPEDSTGVFHILEHSVLNGSRKYPTRDTFLQLTKTSMQNYLNAMTFADKTLYPFATVDETDYLNLLDAYLDAVFYPNVRRDKAIFEQEGWHHQVNAETGKIEVSGVVYNEMKGALSSVDAQLGNAVRQAMFPDNTYHFISGGDPAEIPNLGYGQLLHSHRRYYSSGNCCIVLYGSMDMGEKLAFIHENYLCHMHAGQPLPGIPMQAPVGHVALRKPCQGQDIQSAIAYYAGTFPEREKMMAICVVMNALMGNNDAPLKKRLLSAQLGEDVSVGFSDGIVQPYVIFALRNANAQGPAALRGCLENAVSEICREGISRDMLLAELNSMEFSMLENGGGLPAGVSAAVDAVTGWFLGDDPLMMFRVAPIFQSLREKLDTGYYEELLQALIPDADSSVQVTLEPNMKEQAEETAAEAVYRPMHPLSADTLDCREHTPPVQKGQCGSAVLISRSGFENGIAYCNYYFDLGALKAEDMPYMQLYCDLLGFLPTKHYSVTALSTALNTWIGSSYADTECFPEAGAPDTVHAKLTLNLSILETNLHKAVGLAEELVLNTRFESSGDVIRRIRQLKLYFERRFVSEGNFFAACRVASRYTMDGIFRERTKGYSYYQFLCSLLREENWEALLEKLGALQRTVLKSHALTVSYYGTEEGREVFCGEFAKGELAGTDRQPAQAYRDVCNAAENEAFIVDSAVAYNACGWKQPFRGENLVLSRVLTYDYLWPEVRAKGGAYGTWMNSLRSGIISLQSYRDPHLGRTYGVYADMGAALKALPLTDEQMNGFRIGTMAQHRSVQRGRALAKEYDRRYFIGLTDEMITEERRAICAVTAQTLRGFADALTAGCKDSTCCTFAGMGAVEKEKHKFRAVVDLVQKEND